MSDKPDTKPTGIDTTKLRRPDLSETMPVPGDVELRSARWLSAAILLLAVVMVGGAVAIWKSGAWAPVKAVGALGVPGKPVSAALNAGLESARVYSRRGEWNKAEAVLRELTKQFAMEQDVRIGLAESLVPQKKFPEAYEQYEKALAIGPRDAKLEFAAGITASTAGLYERALEHFTMAQTAEPLNAAYPLNLGMMQRKIGQMDGAKASLLRAANLDPDNAYAWGVLADIALAENNLGLSLQHVAKARALQPESKEWRLIEARALKRKGDPERALLLLTSLDISQRHEPGVARQIAECFGMLQKPMDAAVALSEAANANPTDGALAYDAATAAEKAGDKIKALEWARRAQKLGNENAPKLIERLRS